jgi:hypothetical protein
MPKPYTDAEIPLALALGMARMPEQDIAEAIAAYRTQVLIEAAAAEEGLRARLWLIEQTLTPIDVQQDPAGIVGMIGPILDGPLHPTDLAAYRAAR